MIKKLEELREADERTLRFAPMGLGLSVKMRPEDSAEFQQDVVAQFDLDPSVAEGTRECRRFACPWGDSNTRLVV